MTSFKYLEKLILQKNFSLFATEIEKQKNFKTITETEYFKLKGFYFLSTESYQQAINCYLSFIKSGNETFDVCLNLAVSYAKNKEPVLSYQYFEKSLNLKDDFEDTYVIYSKVLINQNFLIKAKDVLSRGEKRIKNCYKIINILCDVCRELGDYLLAIKYHNIYKKKFPKNHVTLNNLGYCFESIGEIDYAKNYYRSALLVKPDYYECLINLANLVRSEGDFDEAKALYEKCLNLKDETSSIFRLMSLIHKFESFSDKLLQRFLDYEKSDAFNKNLKNQHELYFALAKAYEDIGDKDNFIKYLLLANKIKFSLMNKESVQKDIELFDILKKTFNLEFVKKIKLNNKKCKIFFIVGMPRSGTTLIEQILAAHSKVSSGGEMIYLPKIIRNFFPETEKGELIEAFKNRLPSIIEEMADLYIDRTNQVKKDKIFLTDKLPFNFLYIPLLSSMFDNCKIIHISRDPIDNCYSIFKNYFPHSGITFAYDQDLIAKYYLNYQDLMKTWEDLPGQNIFNIKYENLINSSEVEIKKLLEYCDLDWEVNCLNHDKNKNVIKTLSTSQARKPIYKSSIKSWSNYSSALDGLIKALQS